MSLRTCFTRELGFGVDPGLGLRDSLLLDLGLDRVVSQIEETCGPQIGGFQEPLFSVGGRDDLLWRE